MEQIILLNATEFYKKQEDLIKSMIKESFGSLNVAQPDEILSTSDVCTMLKKSRQTINTWSDKNILKKRYLGDSVFYLRSEVLSALSEEKNTDM